ncbi:MAG: trigger factor [Fibrobacteria bacterium]|nr:trigger factor [Fibrobacteria bacterium]
MENLKVTVSSPSNTERQLDMEVPREQFTDIYKDKVKKYSKELNLKGFRKGTVPKRLVEERFREQLVNETLEKLVQDTLQEACKEHNIQPVAPGNVEELKNEGDQPIVIKAILEVDQEIEINEYKELNVKPDEIEPISDEEVEDQINMYKKGLAKEEVKDGPGVEGDIVIGEYEAIKLDGAEQDLKDQKDFRVEIGKDKIAEFNKTFQGAKSGETKNITVNYPADHDDVQLAGKKGEYQVKIKEIKTRVEPEMDDEFAKKLNFDSMDALKGDIRKNMEQSRRFGTENKAHREAIEKIIEKHPFDVPKAKVKQYIEYGQKQQNGQMAGKSQEELEKEAEFALKRYRIIDQIAKKENIKATQAEVDEKITEMAGQYGMPFDDVKAALRKNGAIVNIREEIKEKKTLDFLIQA